jgi:hypothetical protein
MGAHDEKELKNRKVFFGSSYSQIIAKKQTRRKKEISKFRSSSGKYEFLLSA